MKLAATLFLLSCLSLIAGQAALATFDARPAPSDLEARGKRSTATAGRSRTIEASGVVRRTVASRFVNASGSDRGNCTKRAPCKTLDRAYQVASPGETISVAGGVYSSTWPAAGAHAIMKPGKPAGSAPITFTCSGPVRFDATAPNFMIYPGVHDLKFSGGCFRFHIVQIGLGGYSGLARRHFFYGRPHGRLRMRRLRRSDDP